MTLHAHDPAGRLRVEATAGRGQLLYEDTTAASGDSDVVVGSARRVVEVETIIVYNAGANPVDMTLELGATGSEVPFYTRELQPEETYSWQRTLYVDENSTLVVNAGSASALNILVFGRTHTYE